MSATKGQPPPFDDRTTPAGFWRWDWASPTGTMSWCWVWLDVSCRGVAPRYSQSAETDSDITVHEAIGALQALSEVGLLHRVGPEHLRLSTGGFS